MGRNLNGAADPLFCRVEGAAAGDDLGWSVVSPGDIGGSNTMPEILVAAPGANGGTGAAYLIDGSNCTNGQVLSMLDPTKYIWRFLGGAGERAGAVALIGGSVGGTSHQDFLVMAPLANKIYIIDGLNGQELASVTGAASDSLGGGMFGLTGGTLSGTLPSRYGADGLRADANGDGTLDIVVGAPGNNKVYIIAGGL